MPVTAVKSPFLVFMQSLTLGPENKKPILAEELFLIVITLLNA